MSRILLPAFAYQTCWWGTSINIPVTDQWEWYIYLHLQLICVVNLVGKYKYTIHGSYEMVKLYIHIGKYMKIPSSFVYLTGEKYHQVFPPQKDMAPLIKFGSRRYNISDKHLFLKWPLFRGHSHFRESDILVVTTWEEGYPASRL